MDSGKIPKAGQVPVYCAHDAIINTSDVRPNPKNPNQHPESQITLLAKIIRKQGWRAPITISTLSNMVVRGHGRLMAARRLGQEQVPVDYQDYASEADEYADLIADNRLSELSELDNRMLLDLIDDIEDLGGDLSLTAYSEEELTRMINQISGADDTVPASEDDAPPLPADPITRPGDLWLLGPHRVLCGDATDPGHVGRLMEGDLASLIFTDPPYGINYVSTSDKFQDTCIKGDDLAGDQLIINVLAPAFKLMAKHSTAKAGFYVWHAYQTRKEYDFALMAAGLKERQYLTWVKPHMVLGWSHWRWQSEPCFYLSKAGEEPTFYGDRGNSAIWYVTSSAGADVTITLGKGIAIIDGTGSKLIITPNTAKNQKLRHLRLSNKDQVLHITRADEGSTVWEVGRDQGHEHPTQKPVELGRRAIENGSLPGEIVLDLFLGSGSTLIGAELTGRACYGTELDPAYCDVIVARWERITKRKAERIESDQEETESQVSGSKSKSHKLSEIEGKIIKGGDTFTVEIDLAPDAGYADNLETATEEKTERKSKGKKKPPANEREAIDQARTDGVPF